MENISQIFKIIGQNARFSFVLNYLSNVLGIDIYGVNIFSACIFLLGVFLYAKSTCNPWFALSVIIPFLFFSDFILNYKIVASFTIGKHPKHCPL